MNIFLERLYGLYRIELRTRFPTIEKFRLKFVVHLDENPRIELWQCYSS